eukprot:TRINITY_DN2989_c0_g4_i1.p1 TRINITY_DN2989_c0_g4~~TRINITY_DN2989_c0_g4_i1.p1  ORF type:complete len:332 (+),score=49.52 TRINITY_DN2989_c0_g4_i1:82-996(+)
MVFAVLVAGELPISKQIVNIEVEFPSRPRPVALGRAAQQVLSDEEAARTGHRVEIAAHLLLYEESLGGWATLRDEKQLQHCDQVFFNNHGSQPPAITSIPQPRRPVTSGGQMEPVGGWGATTSQQQPASGHTQHVASVYGSQLSPAPAQQGTGRMHAPVRNAEGGAIRVAVLELCGLEPDAIPTGRAVQAEVALEGYEPLVTLPSVNAYWNEAFDFCPAPEAPQVDIRLTVHSIQMESCGRKVATASGDVPPSGAPVGGVEATVSTDSFRTAPRRVKLPLVRGPTGMQVGTAVLELSFIRGVRT